MKKTKLHPLIAITLICSFLSPFLPAGKENTKSVSASTTVSIDDCSQTAKEIAESRPLCNWLDDESRDANHIYYTLDEENKTATVGTESAYAHSTSGYSYSTAPKNLIIPDYVEKDGIRYTVTRAASCSFYQSWGYAVYLPDTIESIGKRAFFSGPQYIYLGAGVKEIEPSAFYYYVELSSQNPYFVMKDLTLMNKEQTILYYHNKVETSSYSYTVPDTVKEIRDSAFFYDKFLLHVTLPDSLLSIGNDTFSCCYNLYQVEFGNSLQYIGHQAFSGCISLQGIILPDSVSHIGKLAFWSTNIHYFIGARHASYEFIDTDESKGFNSHLTDCSYLEYLTLSDYHSDLYSTTLSISGMNTLTPHSIKKIVLPPTITGVKDYYYFHQDKPFVGTTFYGLPFQQHIALALGGKFADISKHHHDYVETTLTEPTIYAKGVHAEICSACSDIQNISYTDPLPASSAVLALYEDDIFIKNCTSLAEALNSLPHDSTHGSMTRSAYTIVFLTAGDFYLPEGMTFFPRVKSLTLSGCITPDSHGNSAYTRILLTDDLTLQSDLILKDTQLFFHSETQPNTFDLQQYTLKITTDNCRITSEASCHPCAITGGDGSCLWVDSCNFPLFMDDSAFHAQSMSIDCLKLTSVPNATFASGDSSVSIGKIEIKDSTLHFTDIHNELSIGDIISKDSHAAIDFKQLAAPLPNLISISGTTDIPLHFDFQLSDATEEDYDNFRSSFSLTCPEVPLSMFTLRCDAPSSHEEWAELVFQKDEEGRVYLINTSATTTTPIPTDTPATTITPTPTDMPVTTIAPIPTDTPAATITPTPTDMPVTTIAPIPTDMPAATTAPVSTETPTITQTPISTDAPTPSPMPSPLVSAALSSPEDTLPSNEVVEKGNDEGEGKEETKIETSTDIRKKLTLSSLKVTLSQNNLPILVWKKNAHATTYEIYRSSQKNKGYKLLKKLSASQAKYKDSNAKPGKKYYYRIRLGQTAEDKTTVYGKDSAIVSIRTLKLPSPVITSKKGITANRIHYIQLQLKKYGGTNIVLYIKKKGEKERKLKLTSSSIKEQKGIFKLQYTPKNKIYYLRLKTYRKKGNKIYYSKYSNVIKIRL